MLLVSLSSGPRAQAQSPACVPGEGGGCIYIQCHKGQGERGGRGSIAIESEGRTMERFLHTIAFREAFADVLLSLWLRRQLRFEHAKGWMDGVRSHQGGQ